MKVLFVLPSFGEVESMKMCIASLRCQTNPNWEATIINNGPNKEMLEVGRLMCQMDPRVWYTDTEVDTGTPTHNRLNGVKAEWGPNADIITTSSIQDYYLPNAVDEIIKAAQTGAEFIIWNSMNHHYNANAILYAEPKINCIDWGNFALTTEVAKREWMPYEPINDHHADGVFAEHLAKLNLKTHKIDKVLTIHN